MNIEDYLKFLASKIAEAEAKKNVAECIRLSESGIMAMQAFIEKCKMYQETNP